MADRQREEVLNVVLASCIGARGVTANPETILASPGKARAMPDVIVSLQGLRCAVEGKIGDISGAKKLVMETAKERVDTGIAHLAIGVIYPAELRETAFAHLQEAMESANLEFFVYTEAGEGDWRTGAVDSLLNELRRAHEILSEDDIVQRAVDDLNIGMHAVANILYSSAATCDRLIDLLGIMETVEDAKDTD